MNKKIEELAEEAGWKFAYPVTGKKSGYDITIEKFAELIAKECATICETASVPIDIEIWENSTKKEMTAVMALELAKLIKKRFGVE